MQEKNGISQILNLLSPHIKEIVSAIPEEFADRMWEICLRTNQPIIVRCYSEFYFLTENGIVTKIYRDNLPKVKKKEIDETFFKMCEYSVHAKSNEIREGYLTLPGGHRVGVCGTAVAENGRVLTLKYISSLNIRISREAAGCASKIVNEFYSLKKRPGSLLIAGPPASGKTTVLRDLCRQLSENVIDGYRISLIDEREEIAGTFHGEAEYNVGVNVDVLNGYPKAEAILTAVRCFAPQIIICDEVSTEKEAQAVLEGMNSGTEFILTVHAFNKQDLFKRPCVKILLESGVFENVIILAGKSSDDKALFSKYKGSELLNEAFGNYSGDNGLRPYGTVDISWAEKTD